jgi:hypothetical protein
MASTHKRQTAARSTIRLVGLVAYWVVLVAGLLIFPILQGWDALPEPFDGTAFLLILGGVVLSTAIATARYRFIHLPVITALMVCGLFLFLRNQGYLPEVPDSTDRLILERTHELLSDEARWDRSDSRDCTPGSATLTLYCALHQASYDVVGGFRHRRPSLQIVREVIAKRRPTANYDHRVAGFNADSEVSFKDITAVLDASLAAIDTRIARR